MTEIIKATHQGELLIGEKSLSCAVLDDHTRVITMSAVFKAFDRTTRSKINVGNRVINMPSFLDAQNLQPFVSDELKQVISPITFQSIKGKQMTGYDATIIPLLCDVYLSARKKGVLTKKQKPLGEASEMLVRSLSKIGITALVDEATGYQEIRDKYALQKILDAYLLKELAAWAKRFPDEFYKEMFRLRDWNWSFLKRPSYVGKLTNDIIYERLAPGLLDELKTRSPKNEQGKRKGTFQQLLTDDIGHPALAQHLHAVIGLMRAAGNWDSFYRLLQRAFPKKNETMPLLLED